MAGTPTTASRRRKRGTTSAAARIYCAGPLFNEAERREMAAIAGVLESAGFTAFLPHRDGFVFADVVRELVRGGYKAAEAAPMVQRAIFWLDCYETLVGCQGLVLNLNGRVPDEGAVAEAAMAWTAGLPVVVYKDDVRSHILGYDNPLVAGLGGFVRVTTLPEIAYAFTQLLARKRPGAPALARSVRTTLERGKRLSGALAGCASPADIAAAIIRLIRQAEGAASP
jgi:nucleoside 2-deoxyribosyltransferase